MASPKGYERPAWDDRFNRPSIERLRGAMNTASRRLFDTLHRHLGSLDGVRHVLAWNGECWRWTVEYRTRHSQEPLAVVVPSPSNLQVAVPLDRDFTRSLPTQRMNRALKEGLELAADPFDTRWGVWSIQGVGLVEEVVDLVELKRRHLARQVG